MEQPAVGNLLIWIGIITGLATLVVLYIAGWRAVAQALAEADHPVDQRHVANEDARRTDLSAPRVAPVTR